MSEELVTALREFEEALLEEDSSEAIAVAERIADIAVADDPETGALRSSAHAARDRGDSDRDDREAFATFLSSGVEREAGRSVAVTHVMELLLTEERPTDDRIREVVDEAIEAVVSTDESYQESRSAAEDHVQTAAVPPTLSLVVDALPQYSVVKEINEVEGTIRNVGDEPLIDVEVRVEPRGGMEFESSDTTHVESIDSGSASTVMTTFMPRDTGELPLSVVATAENAGSDVVLFETNVVERREGENRDRDDEESVDSEGDEETDDNQDDEEPVDSEGGGEAVDGQADEETTNGEAGNLRLYPSSVPHKASSANLT